MTISLRYCELKWLSYTQVSKSSGFSDNMVYSIPLFFIEVVYFIRLSRGVKNKKNVYFCVLVVVRSFHDSTEIFVERCYRYIYIFLCQKIYFFIISGIEILDLFYNKIIIFKYNIINYILKK